MISIIPATENDFNLIVDIGKVSVTETHRDSCSAEDLNEYVEQHYNIEAITEELADTNNIYHLLYYNGQPAGFSKIVLNAGHENITAGNVTKLDRIYLLKEFHGLKLGLALLDFNIELARNNNQSGIWLYTWVGNARAISFYEKAGFTSIGEHKFYVTKTHYNMNLHLFLDLGEGGGISKEETPRTV